MRYKNIYTILLVALFSLMGETLRAYDLEYTYEGKTLYYKINTAATNEVSVTYKTYDTDYGLSGDIKVPSEVTYNGTTYSVTAIGDSAFRKCAITSIEIPSSVTTIGKYTFSNCNSLTSIDMPSTITSIGKRAFNICSSLTSVDIPSSVTSIKEYTFFKCTSLTNVTIPSSVTEIGKMAFKYCNSLTSINIPSSVISIDYSAFNFCPALTSIVVDAANTVYDSRDNCNAIIEKATNALILGCKTTIIPSTITRINDYAFFGCKNLISIDIPSSVTSISFDAFLECTNLTSIDIPSSVTSIEDGAFSKCTNLTSIDIPSSVTSIGHSAFYLSGLTSINIPTSVTYMGERTFESCNNLTSANILASIDTIPGFTFKSCTNLKNVVIPSTVTFIDYYAFLGPPNLDTIVCKGVTPPSVDEPELNGNVLLVPCEAVSNYQNDTYFSTKNIVGSQQREITDTICVGETYDFYGNTVNQSGVYFHTISATSGSCDSLITLNLFVKPNFSDTINKVIYVGDTLAFNGTNLTTEGTYVANLQTISGCDSIVTLNLLTIPRDTVTLIQIDTVRDTLYENNKLYYTVKYHTLTSSYTAEVTYKSSGENYISGDIVIPSEVNIGGVNYSVTSIGANAFKNCSGLTSVVLPSSITSIGNHAFNNCTNLTSINIPSSVNYIGQSAFYNCKSLISINIPPLVDIIPTSAFNGSGLTSIDIPSTVTIIGNAAFDGTNLTTVTIPSSVNSIGQGAFSNCKYLTSVEISSPNIFDIKEQVFAFCDNLTNISVATGNVYDSRDNCNAVIIDSISTLLAGCKNTIIPSTVTTINKFAFLGCSGLRSITIPASVTTIKNWAFEACDNLDTMICEGVTPPTITNNSTLVGSVLFVPCEAIEAYKNDTYFSSHFGNNILSLDTLTKTIDGTICENETYDFNGKTLSTSGTYYFTEKNTKGCDSTTTLNLVVNPTYDNTINQSIFVGDTFYYNNSALTTTGAYTYTYTTVNG